MGSWYSMNLQAFTGDVAVERIPGTVLNRLSPRMGPISPPQQVR